MRMKSIELKVDVSASVPLPGPLHIAASVFLPDTAKVTAPPIAMFAFPGGGYSRGYFDINVRGHEDYSEAEHHVGRGIIFIAADHPGVGDRQHPGSRRPEPRNAGRRQRRRGPQDLLTACRRLAKSQLSPTTQPGQN